LKLGGEPTEDGGCTHVCGERGAQGGCEMEMQILRESDAERHMQEKNAGTGPKNIQAGRRACRVML
jgi:hypothetical protein